MALLFSDGLDDDIEKLEQKSDELRKEGTTYGEGLERSVGELVISKPSPGSYICRLADSTEFAASPL